VCDIDVELRELGTDAGVKRDPSGCRLRHDGKPNRVVGARNIRHAAPAVQHWRLSRKNAGNSHLSLPDLGLLR
jgi:hypothetical protein